MKEVYWCTDPHENILGRAIAETLADPEFSAITQTKCSTLEAFEKYVTGFGIVPAEIYSEGKFQKDGAEIFLLDLKDDHRDINALKRALRTYIASFAV